MFSTGVNVEQKQNLIDGGKNPNAKANGIF
jgi:hypothetical protein